MSSKNILEPIWQSYNIIRDSLTITRRTLVQNDTRFLKKTTFLITPKDNAESLIEKSKDEIDDYFIFMGSILKNFN